MNRRDAKLDAPCGEIVDVTFLMEMRRPECLSLACSRQDGQQMTDIHFMSLDRATLSSERHM